MLVEKEVIGPGTYCYTDQLTGLPRKLVVTPTETKYWHDQGNKMLSTGLTVPVPCEHDFTAHPMTPADKLKNNAGWVKEYRLGTPKKDGSRAADSKLFAVTDIQDEDLARKLPKTIRYTSPWFQSFTDGKGTEWNNVISHLALTTRPRIVNQAPFPSIAAALSLATEAKVTDVAGKDGFCLSRMGRLVTRKKDKHLVPRYPVAFSLYMGGIALSDDDAPLKKGDEDGNSPSADDTDMMMDDMPDQPPGFADPQGDVQMEELLCDLLGALGIHLEHGGGEAQFKRALYNAAMSKIHELTKGGKGQGAGDTANQPNTGANNTPSNPLIQQEQQPMYMSLEKINTITDPVMKDIALSMYQENVKLRQEREADAKMTASLRDAKLAEENTKRKNRVNLLGMRSPRVKADLDAMLALPAMALSMGDGGAVVDPMAQTLALLEKGITDLPKMMTANPADIVALSQPTDADALNDERINELADSMARKMGAAPLAAAKK